MTLFITNHAVDRIRKRVVLGGMPILMIADKAFQSDSDIPESFKESKYYMEKQGFTTYLYRYYRKVVWIFQARDDGAALITVYDWNNRFKKQNDG